MVEYKTITVQKSVYNRLNSLKPMESVSFSDLLAEMAEQYDPEVTLTD